MPKERGRRPFGLGEHKPCRPQKERGSTPRLRDDPPDLRVQSDSQLMVRQLNGQYRVRDARLQALFERARDLLRHFDRCTILHVRREANKLADKLANRSIDEACKKTHPG